MVNVNSYMYEEEEEIEGGSVPVCMTLAEGIRHGVTATGRQLGVLPAATHGLFKIQYIDGKSGALPEKLKGRYTGVKFAKIDLDAFIEETWKIAQEHTPVDLATEVKQVKRRKVQSEVVA